MTGHAPTDRTSTSALGEALARGGQVVTGVSGSVLGFTAGADGSGPIVGVVTTVNDDGTVQVRMGGEPKRDDDRWADRIRRDMMLKIWRRCASTWPRRGPHVCRSHDDCRQHPALAFACWERQRERTPEQRLEKREFRRRMGRR